MSDRKKTGRPSIYTDALAIEITRAIANNGLGLKEICKLYPHFPNPETIYDWIRTKPIFSELYANAKRSQVEVLVNEIIELSNKEDKDLLIEKDGKTILNSVAVQRNRLQIDTRKWIACKLAPRIYGERIAIEDTSTKELDAEALKRKRELDERFKKDY